MRPGSIALAAAALLGTSGAADASLLWEFNVTVADSGQGTLTTDALSNGSYQITDISGMFAGSAITGLSTYDGADNDLLPAPDYLDSLGISFSLSDGELVNIWSEGPGFILEATSDGGGGYGGTFSAALVPEPATFGIFAIGLAALGLIGWRQRQPQPSAVSISHTTSRNFRSGVFAKSST
jgi:hypothetical protein